MPLVPIDSFLQLTFPFQKMCENGKEEEEESLVALRTSREEEQEQVSSSDVDVSTSKCLDIKMLHKADSQLAHHCNIVWVTPLAPWSGRHETKWRPADVGCSILCDAQSAMQRSVIINICKGIFSRHSLIHCLATSTALFV